MKLPSFAIPQETALGKLLGCKIDHHFTILVHGRAGSGKSHLICQFTRELSSVGSVGIILTEENNISEYLKDRVARYDLPDNVSLIPTRKVDDILAVAKNFDFLIVDSINGMLPQHQHTEFVETLKNLFLKGLIIVNQSNKKGESVGREELVHAVCAEISMESKVAQTGKNRFGGQVGTYTISFDEPEAKRRSIMLNQIESKFG